MKKSVLLAAAAVAVLAIDAQAQMGGPSDRESAEARPERSERAERPDFATLDADSNGVISADELSARFTERPEMAANIMSRMDADENGELSAEEFAARPARDGSHGNH